MSNISLPSRLFNVEIAELEKAIIDKFKAGNSAPDNASLALFLYTCNMQNLNPLAGQAFLIPFQGKWTTCVSFQGLVTIAERSGKFGGFSEPLYLHPEKGWLDYWTDDKAPLAVKVSVRKLLGDQIVDSWGVAYFNEYNKGNHMWKEKPKHMLLKVAKSICIRDAFPESTAGLYTKEEMVASGFNEEIQEAEYFEIKEKPIKNNSYSQETLAKIDTFRSLAPQDRLDKFESYLKSNPSEPSLIEKLDDALKSYQSASQDDNA